MNNENKSVRDFQAYIETNFKAFKVSKQTLYNHIRKIKQEIDPGDEDLYFIKNGNTTYLTVRAQNHLLKSLDINSHISEPENIKNENLGHSGEPGEDLKEIIDLLKKQIELKDQQLEIKDKQLENKDFQINELLETIKINSKNALSENYLKALQENKPIKTNLDNEQYEEVERPKENVFKRILKAIKNDY